uniref:Uncharacterized protein n=1 Tax=Arundo donax TaxID=35708 RepID=A0A0A9G769_ARUDO
MVIRWIFPYSRCGRGWYVANISAKFFENNFIELWKEVSIIISKVSAFGDQRHQSSGCGRCSGGGRVHGVSTDDFCLGVLIF